MSGVRPGEPARPRKPWSNDQEATVGSQADYDGRIRLMTVGSLCRELPVPGSQPGLRSLAVVQ